MTAPGDNPRSIAAIMTRAGLCILLMIAFLRATVAFEPLPGWDMDPTVVYAPSAGLRPAELLMLDALAFAAAAIVMLGEAMRGRRMNLLACVLTGIGCVGVYLHGLVIGSGSLDDLRIGSGWAAAIVAALAAAHACRDVGLRNLCIAALVGFVGMVAAKGAVQFTIEHDITVETFEANREAILRSRGWMDGSAAALAYEHRLRQREATGWFALANAVASVAAGALVALAGWAIIAARDARPQVQRLANGFAALVILGAAGAGTLLVLAGAKGGYAAAGLGLTLLAAMWLARTGRLPCTPRATPWLLAALVLIAPLIAIAIRGLIGERIGELSLLFRWFYVSTAAEIFTEAPLLGVGPSGFQRAYMLHKPAISPEDVQSPHCLTFDYLATMGVFGIAWIALIVMWLAAAARHAITDVDDAPIESPPPPGLAALASVAIIPTIVGFILESPAQNIFESLLAMITRGVGTLAWIGIGAGVLALLRQRPSARWCFAPAVLALAAHGQVEMTPIWVGSAAWFMLMLGVAGAQREHACRMRVRFAPAIVCAIAAIALAVFVAPRVIAWQASLLRAAEMVRPIQQFEARRMALEVGRTDPRFPGDSWPTFITDLGRYVNMPPATTQEAMREQLVALRVHRAEQAALELLMTTSPIFPSHTATHITGSQLSLAALSALFIDREPTQDQVWAFGHLPEAFAILATQSPEAGAAEWAWLGSVGMTRYMQTGKEVYATESIAAMERAAELDPHGLSIRVRLMDTHVRLGNASEASKWAREALVANEKARLDPRKVLQEAELRRVQGVAGGS